MKDESKKHELQLADQNELINIEIPNETIDRIAALADENALWVKLTEGGFIVNGEKVIPELKVVMIGVNPYYVRWVDKKPEKIPYEDQKAPDGFELRCDIKMNIAGTVIGLSLPKTSTKSQLSQYISFLKKNNLRPNQVITQIRSKAVSSPHGKFNVAVFDCEGPVENYRKPAPVQAEPEAGKPTPPVRKVPHAWA